jgi:hypothetical protein
MQRSKEKIGENRNEGDGDLFFFVKERWNIQKMNLDLGIVRE